MTNFNLELNSIEDVRFIRDALLLLDKQVWESGASRDFPSRLERTHALLDKVDALIVANRRNHTA
jgi:hypothetical protein